MTISTTLGFIGLGAMGEPMALNHFEVHGMGHHRDALHYLITVLKLKGETVAAVKVLVCTRNASRYDGAKPCGEDAA